MFEIFDNNWSKLPKKRVLSAGNVNISSKLLLTLEMNVSKFTLYNPMFEIFDNNWSKLPIKRVLSAGNVNVLSKLLLTLEMNASKVTR